MDLTRARIQRFRAMIFRWWKTNKRDLPWRHTRDPYNVAVSEIMLQQTQVARVIPKYTEFIRVWPNIQALARTTPASVLRMWKGMGYNRRSLYLYRMARNVVERYNGVFPNSLKLLEELPGLGKYTARAILVFAYAENVSCVDTNIRRIIEQFFFDGRPQPQKVIQSVADRIRPRGKSWEWHQALMDYGALELRHLRPKHALRKKYIPFKESNRYYRGRIMDLLRERSYTEKSITTILCQRFSKEETFIHSIIDGLIRDRLIERKSNTLLLPE